MGQQATKRQENPIVKKKPRGIICTWIHVVVLVGSVSLLAWFLLVVGFGLCQFVQGEVRTQERMNAIITNNMILLKNEHHFLIDSVNTVLISGKNGALKEVLSRSYALDIEQWVRQKIQQYGELVQQKMPILKHKIANLWQGVFYPLCILLLKVTVIIGTRLFIFLLSLPLFLLFASVGLVDGLSQRDIRKFQGARESTYLFHAAKRIWKSCFLIPLFLYFSWSSPTNAMWFFMPIAIALGLMIQISLKFFKKYV